MTKIEDKLADALQVFYHMDDNPKAQEIWDAMTGAKKALAEYEQNKQQPSGDRQKAKLYETKVGINNKLWLTVNHQSFLMDCCGGTGELDEGVDAKENAEWHRRQLNIAIDRLINNSQALQEHPKRKIIKESE